MSDEMDEIWALYLDDGIQALDAMETALLQIKGDPSAATGDAVSALFRAVHTFKGNSRVLGLGVVESRAHLAEDLIGLVRDEGVPIDAEMLDILIFTSDVLRDMLEQTTASRSDVDPAASEMLMEQLSGKIARARSGEAPVSEPMESSPHAPEAMTHIPAPTIDLPNLDVLFDDFFEEKGSAETEVVETAETEAVETAESEIAPGALIEDPAYRAIFSEMLDEALADLRVAGTEFQADPEAAAQRARVAADRLGHAAGQMGLPAWARDLAAFHADATSPRLEDLIATLERRRSEDLDAASSAPADAASMAPEAISVAVEAETAELAPAASTAPVASAPQPSAGTPAPAASRLVDDPAYRKIFLEMVEEALSALQSLVSAFEIDPDEAPRRAVSAAGQLQHAAAQMGLPRWADTLGSFMASPDLAGIVRLVETLENMLSEDFPETAGAVAPAAAAGVFFETITPLLGDLSSIGSAWARGEAPEPASLSTLTLQLGRLSAAEGYVRIAAVAEEMSSAMTAAAYRELELDLYEKLSAIERDLPASASIHGAMPSRLLQAWCADHAFDTLEAIEGALERLKHPPVKEVDLDVFERKSRLLHHACLHYGLQTASQLAMSLVDLFSRVQVVGRDPDPILIHIARNFIATLELIFDAIEQGETPDTRRLDELLDQASDATFTSQGLMTAAAIERRLGLPDVFRRALSPEAVRTAFQALEKGWKFYIIRADINRDENLGQTFLDWIGAPDMKPITNVTVFRGDETLFDFLLASPRGEEEMREAILALDPTGFGLRLEGAMSPAPEKAKAADAASSEAAPTTSPAGIAIGVEVLETISEVAASQAMVDHMISGLVEADLADEIEAALRLASTDIVALKAEIRRIAESRAARLQEVAQASAQLAASIAELQEQTESLRSRSLEGLARGLQADVAAAVARGRGPISMSVTGAETVVDVSLVDSLRRILKLMLADRLSLADAPSRVHVAFRCEDDRVTALIEDDGPSTSDPLSGEIEALLEKTGAAIRTLTPPGGGLRRHLDMPLSMAVLEGMVVGVGGVRYVIPVDAIRAIIQPKEGALRRISADRGRQVLQLEDGEMLAVHHLEGGDGAVAERGVFVAMTVGGRGRAVPVDEIFGQQLVLLRPLKGVLRRIRNLAGVALLAGGEVGMVISTAALAGEEAEA